MDRGASGCCGSTRVLSGGDHVTTGWGGTPWTTVNRSDGRQVFRLDAIVVYRGVRLEPGWASPDELRAGMDAQYDDRVFVGD